MYASPVVSYLQCKYFITSLDKSTLSEQVVSFANNGIYYYIFIANKYLINYVCVTSKLIRRVKCIEPLCATMQGNPNHLWIEFELV